MHLKSCLDPHLGPVVLVAVCGFFPIRAGAVRVVIPCGRDATLFESCGCYANGAGDGLFSGQTLFFGSRRALLWFAVGDSIPSPSLVDSVRLELHTESATAGASTHTLHRLAADWGEGNSVSPGGGGATATPGDATWTHTFYDVSLWASPGGDFQPSASAAASVGDLGAVEWRTTPEMVADVQAWVDDPHLNYGWILIGDETTDQTAKRFASREHASVDHRPVLIVDYTPQSAVESRTWSSIKSLYVPHPGAEKPEDRP